MRYFNNFINIYIIILSIISINIVNIYFIIINISILLILFILLLNLEKQIETLKNDLQNEINKNKILNEQIMKLKNDLNIETNNKNKLIDDNEQLKQQIKDLIDSQKQKESLINSNNNKIVQLYLKIDELKDELSRYPLELSKGEKLISVIFTSSDKMILYSAISKNTEKFIKLEEKLYNNYPEYSKSDNYFMVNGNIINKINTLDENKIKDSDNIILTKKAI